MKKRILLGIGAFIVLILASMIVLPIIYKGKIVEIVKKEANKNLNARVNFSKNIGLNLFSSFPDMTLRIDDLVIANNAPFIGDTLASVKSIRISLDLMSIFKGDKLKIHSVDVEKPDIYLHVLNDSLYSANWDITLPDTSTTPSDTSSSFMGQLSSYAISHGNLVYNDESMDMRFELKNFEHKGKGDFTLDVFDLDTKTQSDAFTFRYGGINYLSKIKTSIDAKLKIDLLHSKYSFLENEIWLNNLLLKFEGSITMPEDDITMDLRFKAPNTDFKNLISLIPAIYSKDFENLTASGQMNFEGQLKGIYNDSLFPGYHIGLGISNGMFKYPELPLPAKNVNLNLAVDCPDGNTDHTIIDLKKLHAELGNDPFDAALRVKTPISDPFIQMMLKGKVDLGNLAKIVPLEEGTNVSGIIKTDLSLDGHLSSIEAQKYDEFKASGTIDFSNLKYASADLPMPVSIPSMNLAFSPQFVNLSNFKLIAGKSDLSANGKLTNFIPYIFHKGILNGNLALTSSVLDLNEFLSAGKTSTSGQQTTAESDTSSNLSSIALPGNVHFEMNSSLKRIFYEKMDIRDALCLLVLDDKVLYIKNMSSKLLNGSMTADGFYDTRIPEKPKFDFNLIISKFNIAQTFATFATVQKFAPIAKFIKGDFDAKLNINSVLSTNMMPDLMSLISNGLLSISQMQVSDFKPVSALAGALKMDSYKTLAISNIKPSYKIENGRFSLKDSIRFEAQNAKFSVCGSTGLDKSIDYGWRIMIPSSDLKAKSSQLLNQLGLNVNSPLGDYVTVFVRMTGDVNNPKIQTSVKQMTQSVTNTAKTMAQNELNKQKTQAAALVKAREDSLRNQALLYKQQQLKLLEEQKKAAEAKARAEAEKKKQQLIQQGQNKLKTILK